MKLYKSLIRPLLFQLDPERAHDLALLALSRTPLARLIALGQTVPQRPVSLWGMTFRNPLGVAAGVDKNGVAVDAWKRLGFGFCEIGTVTHQSQMGNPRPRIIRYPEDKALVNRLGFPNDGSKEIRRRLSGRSVGAGGSNTDFPVGINIGKSKSVDLDDAANDYLSAFTELYDSGDYFVVNVSSPNTPGLRELQQPSRLADIVSALQNFNRTRNSKPLLVKIAPDLSNDEIAEILAVCERFKLAGVVATNTTCRHSATLQHRNSIVRGVALPICNEVTPKPGMLQSGRVTPVQSVAKLQSDGGGLSGRPLRKKSTDIIRFIARETNHRLPIIGVGGVFTADDFNEKIDAGASLVQLYTGLIFEGPRIAYEILTA